MATYADRLLKSIEVLQPTLPIDSATNLSPDEIKEATPQSRVAAVKVIVHSLSHLSTTQFPDYNDLLSLTFENLLASCNDKEADVRVAADEGLNHLINELYGSDSSRIQVELFKEIKRNASPRRVKAAIVRFAELAYLIKPQKCRAYVMNLLPLLIAVCNREDEGIQESLITTMPKIVSVLGPFFSESELHNFLKNLFEILVSKLSSSRRMAAECITSLCHSCLKPGIFYSISLEKMLVLTITQDASPHALIGGFLGLRKILVSVSELPRKEDDQYFFNLDHVSITFLVIFRSLSHSDHNVITAALSTLQTLIEQNGKQLSSLLLSDVSKWNDRFQGKELGEFMLGTKHSNKNMLLATEIEDGTVSLKMEDLCGSLFEESGVLLTEAALFLSDKFLVHDGEVVKGVRVSVKSLVINCLTELTVISPELLSHHLAHLPNTFKANCDPMLQGNVMALCGTYILHFLVQNYYLSWSENCEEYINIFIEGIKDESSKVHKACCDATKICIPALMKTNQSDIVIDLIEALLPLHLSAYWLVKTSLLEVIKEINFSYLHCFSDRAGYLQKEVLNALFVMLKDEDVRVQSACASCFASITDNLCFTTSRNTSIINIVRNDHQMCNEFVNPPQYAICLPSDSSQHIECKTSQNVDSLSRLLNVILEQMISSKSTEMVRGCIETLACLSNKYVNCSMLKYWGISIPAEQQKINSHHIQEGTVLSSSSGLISFLTQHLTSSMYMYDISSHQNLLTTITNLLGATCKHLISNNSYSADLILSWSLLNDENLVEIIQSLVYHIMRVLNICSHVCGEEDPTVDNSNFKEKMSAVTNKRKKKDDEVDAEPVVEQDGNSRVGAFTALPHYMKLYENLKASYEAHKVSLDLQADEKFVLVLRGTLSLFQEILKYSSLKNVGSFSEEVNEYLTKLLKKEPIQCVTTTRYLLASLFGTNVICTNLNSSGKSSQLSVKRPIPTVVSIPVHIEYFKYSPYIYTTKPVEEEVSESEEQDTSFAAKIFGKKFQRNQKKKTEKKPDPKPVMQNYIRYFEANVMKSLELYTTLTNDTQVQGEILVLLIDLLRLRVNYSLLDTGKVFVNFLLRQFEYIEQGQVREASKLLPTLFQFLIMLTKEKYQEDQIIDIPRIMQLCGTAMASGQLNTASISVSLYPLIHELFVVQESNNVPDIITQREVVESILLKNVIHYQVIDILWIVLHWYTVDARNFKRYSATVWSAVSIAISQGRLDVSSHKVMVSMHRLLDIISHENINVINTLLEFISSSTTMSSRCSYICLILRYLLIIITKGHMQKTLDENSSAMMTTAGLKETAEVSPIMKFLKFLLWTLQENLVHLLKSADLAFSSFSSLNYVHKLVYHVRENHQFDVSDFDFSEMKKQVVCLSVKHPACTLVIFNICRVLNVPDFGDCFGECLVSKFLQLSHGSKVQTLSAKKTLAQIVALKNFSLPEYAQKLCQLLQECGDRIGYSTMIFSSHCTIQYLAMIMPEIGNLDKSSTINALQQLNTLFAHQAADMAVKEKIRQCLQLLGHSEDQSSQKEKVSKNLTYDGLQKRFSEELCTFPCTPSQIVPVLRDMPLHILKNIVSNPDFDTELFVGMIKLGTRELCCQKSAYIDPDEPLPQLPAILLSAKSQLLQRISVFTGVCSPAPKTTKHTHTHSKSNSTSLPKSVALFVDTSAFSDPQELLSVKDEWKDEKWRRQLRNYTRATTALLNTAILYPDIAYLDPYHIHAITRLLALAMTVNHHFERFSEASTCLELLELLLAIIITRDTCAVIHYGEDMNIVENVYHILVQLFGKTLTKSEPTPESKIDKVRLMVNFVLYKMPADTHHSISDLNVVKKCILSLASLPCVSNYLRIPTLLALTSTKPEDAAEFSLSSIELEYLKDSEVLEDFLYRNLSFGWSTKRQFEELWVTMLGMITYRFDADLSKEEINELSVVNRLAVRGMTALLMQTILHPVPGSPKTSVYQHFPRTQQVPFLTTTMGQRMIFPHKLVFDKLLNASKLTPAYQPHFPDLNAFIDSEFSYQLIDTGASAQAIDKVGVFIHDLNRIPGSSSYCHGYYSATALRERIITNDVTDLDNDGVIERSLQPLDDSSDTPDIMSCLHFLVDLFAEWTAPESNIPITLLNQIINSVSQLSDMFQKTHHCQWMVDGLLRILINHPLEDSIVHSKLLFTLSKAISLLQADKAGEKLMPFIEEALSSDFLVLQQSALNGSFYLLESQLACFEGNLVSVLAEFVMNKLKYDVTMPANYLASIWAIAVTIREKFPEACENFEGFTMLLMQFGMQCLSQPSTPFIFYQFVIRGFQRLVLSFSLPSSEFDILTHLSTNQLERDDPQKCLSAFGLLMTCMYCGREGSRVINLDRDQDTTDQMLAGAMDKMRKILDCVGHCCDTQAKPLAAVICYLVTDFFPKEQMINTFVSEFLSPRQQNRHLISLVLYDLFQGMIASGNFSQICEWVLLVLRNFVQLKPLQFSMWSTSVLLLCSSKNRNLSRFLPYIVSNVNKVDGDVFVLICKDFSENLSKGEKAMFLEMLDLGSKAHSGEMTDNDYGAIHQILKEMPKVANEQ